MLTEQIGMDVIRCQVEPNISPTITDARANIEKVMAGKHHEEVQFCLVVKRK